jgi:DNA polymerase III epsilon subunit family exonuclease
MRLFAPVLAFVDLETTGTAAATDAITEIGIVRVEADPEGAAPPRVTVWSTLVNPGMPIPPEIQALTGITNAMVRDAPPFSRVADEVSARTAGALFVAHNARFDYGFLKHAFARQSRAFSARVLCTVRLSRRLFPDEPRHNLDSVIARHGLSVAGRHRALGDARVLWTFVQTLYRDLPADAIESAAKRVLKTPSLPPQLAPDALDALPEAPGVYLFYGLNALPLYIGKSTNLRERVGAHFSSDYRSATDLRLSTELQRIEFQETAGEIGALLREAALVKSMLPAQTALRERQSGGHVARAGRRIHPRRPRPAELAGGSGRFVEASSARTCASQPEHVYAGKRWAQKGSGRASPAGELRRRASAPIRSAPRALREARRRCHSSLAVRGAAAIRERRCSAARRALIRDWCWLCRDDGELGRLSKRRRVRCSTPTSPAFMRTLARGKKDAAVLTRELAES